MNKEDAKKIWASVQENHRKLDACERHDFSIDDTPERQIGKIYQCTRCGGKVDSITKHWYEKGLEHAGGG